MVMMMMMMMIIPLKNVSHGIVQMNVTVIVSGNNLNQIFSSEDDDDDDDDDDDNT